MQRNTGRIYLVEKSTRTRVQEVWVDLSGLSRLGRYERLNYLEDELMLGRDPRRFEVDVSELEGHPAWRL
ncbi:MAG: hypothetical protein M0T84_17005 [Betaproteobacteria bacterium]|nr:hypothetical protein [Betaproteobacteria bacterium]